MQTIQIRTIFEGEISPPIDFQYDPDTQVMDLSLKITETFHKNVKHLVQAARLLNNGDLSKDAIGPAGYLFAILGN